MEKLWDLLYSCIYLNPWIFFYQVLQTVSSSQEMSDIILLSFSSEAKHFFFDKLVFVSGGCLTEINKWSIRKYSFHPLLNIYHCFFDLTSVLINLVQDSAIKHLPDRDQEILLLLIIWKLHNLLHVCFINYHHSSQSTIWQQVVF